MRKFFAVITLAAALLSLLGGCGEKELEPIEKAQAKAVEIGQQYLDFEITGKEAAEMLGGINVPKPEGGNGQTALKSDISALCLYLLDPNGDYDKIQKKVDYIESRDYTK